MAAYYESNKFKEMLEDKEKSFAVKFLRACNNFNTNRENAILLMYGFINDLGEKDIDKQIYKNFTKEIIKRLIQYVNITTNTDKWSSDFTASTNGHAILSNQQQNMKLFDDARCLKVIKYGYGECYGIHRLYETAIRKLWKIQIKASINENNNNNDKSNSHSNKHKKGKDKQSQQPETKEESLQFAIGIDNYIKRYHVHLTNLNLLNNDDDNEEKEKEDQNKNKDKGDKEEEKDKGGKKDKKKEKGKVPEMINDVIVKDGDIISVLFYQSDVDQNVIKFALNNEQIGREYKDIRVSSNNGRGGRIVVTFYQTMQFIMLKDKDE